jgi:prepilin-type processing-associated H-X9-DG protein
MAKLQSYTHSRISYRCPSDRSIGFIDWSDLPEENLKQYRWSSYSVNGRLDKPPYNNIRRVPNPKQTIYLCETPENLVGVDHVHPELWLAEQDPLNHVAHDRHSRKSHFLFLDWSVQVLSIEETWQIGKTNLWNPRRAPQWSTPRDY